MNPSYRDLLTDLGISDRVVEKIQKLNKEYLNNAHNESMSHDGIQPDDFYPYLRSEGFIK